MRLWRRVFPGRHVPVWYDRAYRLALPGLESAANVEPRRADFVAYLLQRMHVLGPGDLRAPAPIPYSDLARVHTPEYLESLQSPETGTYPAGGEVIDAPGDRDYEKLWDCGSTAGVYVHKYDATNKKLRTLTPSAAQQTGLTETTTVDLSAQVMSFGAIRPT